MLTPKQIKGLQDAAEKTVDPIIEFLLRDIARRVSEAGQLTSTAAYQIWKVQELGISQKQVKKEIQKILKVSAEDAEKLMQQSAEVGYRFDLSRLQRQLSHLPRMQLFSNSSSRQSGLPKRIFPT